MKVASVFSGSVMKLTHSITGLLMSEQKKKQVIIAEIIIKFEFQFIDEQAYIKHAFKSMHTIRKQQHSNPPIKTTAMPYACSWNSLSHLFPFSAFPLAEIGKLELCHYHQYLYELRQRILHQYDPICPLVVLQWMKGLLDQDLNEKDISITNPGVCIYSYIQDWHVSIIHQWLTPFREVIRIKTKQLFTSFYSSTC